MAKRGLTTKQKMFVEAYLGEAFFNATEAGRKAGLKHPRQQGSRMLSNVDIQAAIAARVDEAAMTANEVLARLSKHARASLADVLTEDGDFVLKEARKRGTDDLLKKLKKREHTTRTKDGDEFETVTYEYEIHDPQAALIQLGKYHKLFTDKTELSGPNNAPLTFTVNLNGSGSK